MEFISSWVQGIIVAVIIATIIEMILPNGNSKKYIKIVIGVYIIFNIISPIINKFTGNKLDFSSIIDINKYEEEIATYEVNPKGLEQNNNSNIKEVYILNFKKTLKAKIEEKGYIVNSIYIDLEDTEEYEIKSVNLTISKKQNTKDNENISNAVNKIETVNIQVQINNDVEQAIEQTNNLTQREIEEIITYINSTYEIDKNNIHINE